MSGGYETPAVGELGELLKQITDIKAQIREIGRPTGTQTAESLVQLRAAFEQLEATVAQVGSVVDDLSARRAYGLSNAGFVQSYSGTFTGMNLGVDLSIVLASSRRVTFTATVAWSASLQAAAGIRQIEGGFTVALAGTSHSQGFSAATTNTGITVSSGTSVISRTVTLPAGTHTFQPRMFVNVTGSVLGAISNPSLSVQILDPA